MNYREIMLRLNNALNHLDSAYAAIAKKHSMTFNALMIVCMLAETENVTQKQICDSLHLPKSTVHSILLDFIKQDYVFLVAGSNKKEKYIIFTEKGSQNFSDILKETWLFEDKILSALGSETCNSLVNTAEKLDIILKKCLWK